MAHVSPRSIPGGCEIKILIHRIQNMHEMACVSGIAAAYRLGADYEVFDDLAEDLFKKYLLISHGVRYKGGKKTQ